MAIAYIQNGATGGTLDTIGDPYPPNCVDALAATSANDELVFLSSGDGSEEVYLIADSVAISTTSGTRKFRSNSGINTDVVLTSAYTLGVFYWNNNGTLHLKDLTVRAAATRQTNANATILRVDGTTKHIRENVIMESVAGDPVKFVQNFDSDFYVYNGKVIGELTHYYCAVTGAQLSANAEVYFLGEDHQCTVTSQTANAGFIDITDASDIDLKIHLCGTNIKTTAGVTGAFNYITCEGVDDVSIIGNSGILDGAASNISFVLHDHHLTATTSVIVANNTVTNQYLVDNPTLDSGGGLYGIRIGSESAATSTISGGRVYGNTLTGFDHAFMFGGGTTDCVGWDNHALKSQIQFICDHAAATCGWLSGTATQCIASPASASALLLIKASAGTIANIDLTIPQGWAVEGLFINNDATVNSTDAVFANIKITLPSAMTGDIIALGAASAGNNTGTFSSIALVGDVDVSNYDHEGANQTFAAWLDNTYVDAIYINPASLKALGQQITVSSVIAKDSSGHQFLDPPSIGSKELGISSGSTGSNGIATKGLISR